MGGRGSSSGFQKGQFKEKVNKVEKTIAGDKTETAYLFDDNGDIVFSQNDGAESYVMFTPTQVSFMPGKTLTHNHPSGTTFSCEDVGLFEVNQIKEIRAVTKDGTFSLSRSPDPTVEQKRMVGNFDLAIRNFQVFLDQEYNDMSDKFYSGDISQMEFQAGCDNLNSKFSEYRQEWLEDNASRHGYIYKFERGDESAKN